MSSVDTLFFFPPKQPILTDHLKGGGEKKLVIHVSKMSKIAPN